MVVNGGAGYTCWSPRLLLLSPRHSDRHVPRCFSCRNYKQIKSISFEKSSRFFGGGQGLVGFWSLGAENCQSSFQTGCSFWGLVAGSASARISSKITKGFGQLLTPSCPSKIIFLHLSHGRVRGEKISRSSKQTPWNPSFQFTSPLGKIPLISSAVWRGTIVCCAFYAQQN